MFCAMRHGKTANFVARHAIRLGAAALAVSALSGCQSIDVNSSNAAQVRVFNASPDSMGFDFYTGKIGIVYNLGFPLQTTYVSLNPGTQTITTDQAGTTQVLASSVGSFGSQKAYTVIASNTVASLQESIYTDQNFAAPLGQVAVRVINDATRIGPVDVYLVPSGGKLSTTIPVATNVAFNGNSGYIDIPVGIYSVAILPAGTSPGGGTSLFYGTQANFASGCALTVIVFDTPLTTAPAANATVLTDFQPPTTTG